jgi:hypothetical protein
MRWRGCRFVVCSVTLVVALIGRGPTAQSVEYPPLPFVLVEPAPPGYELTSLKVLKREANPGYLVFASNGPRVFDAPFDPAQRRVVVRTEPVKEVDVKSMAEAKTAKKTVRVGERVARFELSQRYGELMWFVGKTRFTVGISDQQVRLNELRQVALTVKPTGKQPVPFVLSKPLPRVAVQFQGPIEDLFGPGVWEMLYRKGDGTGSFGLYANQMSPIVTELAVMAYGGDEVSNVKIRDADGVVLGDADAVVLGGSSFFWSERPGILFSLGFGDGVPPSLQPSITGAMQEVSESTWNARRDRLLRGQPR